MRQMVVFWLACLLAAAPVQAATLDSYRFFHVSLQTVWWIGIGIFVLVMVPLVVAAVLYWRYAGGRGDKGEDDGRA